MATLVSLLFGTTILLTLVTFNFFYILVKFTLSTQHTILNLHVGRQSITIQISN